MTFTFPADLNPDTVLRHQEPLAPKTTMGVGGPALCFAEPVDVEDLLKLIQWAKRISLPWFVLGRGANVIVPDEGFPGLVLRLNQSYWKRIEISSEGDLLVGSGARLQQISAEACRAGMCGFEFLEGIPGTLGGALRMNAGAMGGWIFDRVVDVDVLLEDGQSANWKREQMHPAYRNCPDLVGRVALAARLRPTGRASVEAIRANVFDLSQRRKRTQPREASAGCMFKNPSGDAAGRMIDHCGLKGIKIGHAEISSIHANFVVNPGDATAGEIIDLVRKVRREVFAKHGTWLEPEAILLGKRWEDVL